LRRTEPATAAAIRRELRAAQDQHAVTIQQRDLCAFDAVRDDAAALRWSHLTDTASALAERMQMLTAALAQAEAQEADAARQAEARRRAHAVRDYQQHTREAQEFLTAVLAHLPDGETLTAARDWRDRLAAEARDLRPFSRDVTVRRPLDPLDALVSAMQHRIDRVSRARWAPSAPITLAATTDAVTAAAARVGTVERTEA
jgi:hypothetical protein